MKTTFKLLLTLILGIGIMTSCSDQAPYEELENLYVEVYKSGSADVTMDYIDFTQTTSLETNFKMSFKRSETRSVTIVAKEDDTVIRINGQLIYLDIDESYIFKP